MSGMSQRQLMITLRAILQLSMRSSGVAAWWAST